MFSTKTSGGSRGIPVKYVILIIAAVVAIIFLYMQGIVEEKIQKPIVAEPTSVFKAGLDHETPGQGQPSTKDNPSAEDNPPAKENSPAADRPVGPEKPPTPPIIAPQSPLSRDYDLPELLNIPAFAVKTRRADGGDVEAKARRVAAANPGSILALYREMPATCARQPFKPHLDKALQRFGAREGRVAHPDETLARRKDCLVVHMDVGRASDSDISALSTSFTNGLAFRARKVSKVLLILSGDQKVKAARVDYVKQSLRDDSRKVVLHDSRGHDEDIYLMHIASNLLVHRGAFSALGAFVCEGKVYYTSVFDDYAKQDAFRWLLKDGQPALDSQRENRVLVGRMGPVVPTCCKLEPFGTGDGEKIVCVNTKSFTQEPCWILSIGCNGQWEFETSIVERTKCKVHTFDCTGSWPVPYKLRRQVTLHKLCLGKDDDARPMFIGWKKMIALGSLLSEMNGSQVPAVVKMDIEGFEIPVLQALFQSHEDEMLPEQLAVEVHAETDRNVGPPFVKASHFGQREILSGDLFEEVFRNFSERGYKLVHRADNPFSHLVSEVTLVRSAALPQIER